MTTPPVCTRTDPHPPHPYWETNVPGIGACPGVPTPSYGEEQAAHLWSGVPDAPSADGPGLELPAALPTQATPDPRLDVVEHVLDEVAHGNVAWHSQSRAILDALDAMRPDEPLDVQLTGGTPEQHAADLPESWGMLTCHHGPAPAGLSAAQEIQRMSEQIVQGLAAIAVAQLKPYADAMRHITEALGAVEHGDDESPDTLRLRDAESRVEGLTLALAAWKQRCEQAEDERDQQADCPHPALHDDAGVKRLYEAAGEANAAAARAEVRADLAEARLGQVRDIRRDFDPHGVTEWWYAVGAALAWTPDDTATVQRVTENDDGVWHHTAPAGADAQCPRDPRCTDSPGHVGPCPTGAATGDGSTLPRVLEYRTKEAPDGDA